MQKRNAHQALSSSMNESYDTRTLHFASPFPCQTRHSADRTWNLRRTLIQTLGQQG